MKPRVDVTRYLPKHPTRMYRSRHLGNIDSIVIHHSATEGGDPWAFARYHVSKDYPGIAYHSVIMPDGLRFKTNHDSTISWHTQNFNSTSLGIVLVGNLSESTPTNHQKLALFDELMLYGRAYKINPTKVYGHREHFETGCPGANISMEDIRGMYRFIML